MPGTVERPADPTKPTSVTSERLRQYDELARALPTATRDEIVLLQTQLQHKLDEVVQVTIAQIRAAPEETLTRIRRGEPALRA